MSCSPVLTDYNGTDLTYDAVGNMTDFGNNMHFTWDKGNQLASVVFDLYNLTVSYKYDQNGMRTQKVNHDYEFGDMIYDYTYVGSVLVRQTLTEDPPVGAPSLVHTLDFIYDAVGTLVGVKYFDGTSTENYYYMYNLQGDVIGLYDSDGAIVARYVYDSWGEMLDVTDAIGNDIYDDEHIGNANPIRYRGYYFDEELYMYYCQSRYYMPGFARFLNADALFVSGNDLTGANMYAYCYNNPVNYADPTGCAANDFSASMANSLKVIGWIALLYQLTGSNDVVNELWSIAAGSYETFFEKAQWALEIVYVKGALGAGGASAASDVTSGVLHSLASGATQATRLRLSEATRFISLSGSGLGVRVTTISPTAAGKAATAGLKAIPYVAAVTGLAIDTYQDYNKYGGNTKEFWTATGFNVVGSAGGVAAAAAIGALIPGPGWAFAIGTATGFAISFGAEYLKRKTLGQ